jgi:hypothetical protein
MDVDTGVSSPTADIEEIETLLLFPEKSSEKTCPFKKTLNNLYN